MKPEEGLEMKTSRLLISSAMLTAMCDTQSVDNLKLLERFVTMCIADSTTVGKKIDKQRILELMDQQYAFSNMPLSVLDKILQRMARPRDSYIIRISHGDYKLSKSLESALALFKSQEALARSEIHDIVVAITNRLASVAPNLHATEESVTIWLGEFFESRGFDVLFDVDELRANTIGNTDERNYQIGRFVLEAKDNNLTLFSKIENIARGIMLTSAIYIDTSGVSSFTRARRLTNLSVYLDTTLVLCALGYKLPERKKSADVLLNMLRENGARLYMFPQHYDEIMDILRNFRDRDAYSLRVTQPLEGLEQLTPIEVDHEIHFLKSHLEKMEITISQRESYVDEIGALKRNPAAYIDYAGLTEHISKRITRYSHSPKMLENDIDAISYITMQRNGMKYETIESCPSIFLTTNNNLVREANRFLHCQAYHFQISPLITDTDLTSILWVKYSMQNRQIPRLLLVSAASAAVTPTFSVMERFYDITVRMSKRGDLTEDEAANLRFSTYARAEIMALCGGNWDAIDDTSVLAVRDRVKAQYAKEATLAATKAREDAVKANQRYDAASEKLLAQQSTVKSSIGELRRKAREDADNHARNISYLVKNCITALLIIIMIVSAVVTVSTGVNGSKGIISLVAIIISGGGAVSLWVPLLNLGKKLQDFVFTHTEGKMYMKELEKISPQIKVLEDILNSNSDI